MPAVAQWNPNSPTILGLEQQASAADTFRIAGLTQAEFLRFTASASAAASDVAVWSDVGSVAPAVVAGPTVPGFAVGLSANLGRQGVAVDLLQRVNELAASAVTVDTYPVTAITPSGSWTDESGGVPAFGDVTAGNDGAYLRVLQSNAWVAFTFGGASALASSRHVLAVEFEVWASGNLVGGRTIGNVSPVSGLAFDTFPVVASAVTPKTVRYGEHTVDEKTGANGLKVWTPAMVNAFAAAGTSRLVLITNGSAEARVDFVVMRVYSTAELRVAAGIMPPVSGGLATATLAVPATGATFSTTIGSPYSALLRRPYPSSGLPSYSDATLLHRRIKGAPVYGANGVVARAVATVDLAGPSYQPTSVNAADDAVLPSFRLRNAGVERDETQPYYRASVLVPLDLTSSMQGIIALPSSASYDTAYLTLSADLVPDAGTLAVFLGDSAAPRTATTLVTKADVAAAPVVGTARVRLQDGTVKTVTLHRVRIAFTSVTALTGAYGIVYAYPGSFGASGNDATKPWVMAFLDDVSTTYSAGGATGLVSNGQDAGADLAAWTSVGAGRGDLVGTIAQAPAVPASVTATANLLGGVTPRVQVAWTNPAGFSSTGFLRWEVQRFTTADGWQDVAAITVATDRTFDDLEPRIGVAATYRVRQVRAGENSSAWATSSSATPAAAKACTLHFTSNALPTTGLGYDDVDSGQVLRDYTFLDADDVEFRRIYGRDYQVAFRAPEKRGVRFRRRLLVLQATGIATPPAAVGPAAFDALRSLAASTVAPYTCVRDGQGNRWHAEVVVDDGSHPNVAPWQHEATITVTETTGTPMIATA